MDGICKHTISALAFALILTGAPALAAEHHDLARPHGFGGIGGPQRGFGEHFGRPVPDFHGRAFGRFAPEERALWGTGHWAHDWHGSRYGWWWVLGDYWYFYPEPIYPYPTYVAPPVVELQAPPVPSSLPPAQSSYFCDRPQGYYPYVASCNGPWREVPVSPPPAPNAPPSAG